MIANALAITVTSSSTMIAAEVSARKSSCGFRAQSKTMTGRAVYEPRKRSWIERPVESATYELTYDADYRGIALVRDEEWPRAGSIEYALEVHRTRTTGGTTDTRHFTLDAQLKPAPGGRAMLTLDGGQHYQLDLGTAVVARMAH